MAHIKKFDEYKTKNEQDKIREELYNFTCLSKDLTNLPIDIYIDEDCSYIHNRHPFLIYIHNGYTDDSDYIGMTICSNPQILSNKKIELYHNDIVKLKLFVFKHTKMLKDVCDGKMRTLEFINHLRNVNESSIQLILEMSKVLPDKTGIPFTIYIGVMDKEHGVGVKFPSKLNDTNSKTFAEMAVATCKIYSNNGYDNDKAKWVRCFIDANKDLLLTLNNDPDAYDIVINNLIQLDNDMNPIKKEPLFRKVDKEYFGLTKVKNKDGKFNFIDSDGELISQIWFDVANNFTKIKSGIIHAYVIVDDVDGFIDKTSKLFIPNE